jgi:hypothetical protein
MRLFEISAASSSTELVALSQFIKGRIKDTAVKKSISVDAFVKLANNLGIVVSPDTISDLISQQPLSNLIKNVRDGYIYFNGTDSEFEPSQDGAGYDKEQEQIDQAQRVAQMAKRQLRK